jgi:hypothetical protein
MHERKNKKVRTELFWVIMQQVAVISYRRFRTTYQSHLQEETPEDGTDRQSQNVGKKLPLLSCVITQKSSVLIYFAAES